MPAFLPATGASFGASKGDLPWPVSEGTITSHFGKQPHPVLEDVYTYNNGIDISTTAGASALCVFGGTVSAVTNIPGSGWLVIVRHGDYLTAYAKLSSVSVKIGDTLKSGQVIGKVSTDDDDGTTLLHFEVWKTADGKSDKMDPEAWIRKK